MKKVRIDYYRYRIRKGRADILLQRVEGKAEYCIPFHYVREDEPVAWFIKHKPIEDDENGDLVIFDISLNDCHLKKGKKGEEKDWIPLNDVTTTSLSRNESLALYKKIFVYFLSLCPEEGNSTIVNRVRETLETVMVEMAKRQYVNALQKRLDEGEVVYPGGYSTPPDPELVKKEIETLEHFRLYKPQEIPANFKDGINPDSLGYTYEPIDWEIFGSLDHFSYYCPETILKYD